MLDSIDFTRGKASERGKGVSGNLEEEEVNQEDRESNFDESETRDKRSKLDSDSEDGEEPSSKETYSQLEDFATDPKGVVNDILSTPGCLPFPPSEWLNIVQWKYVNLTKVLNSAHTTELDPKKMHIIDDEIELALQVTKSSTSIRTSSDHNIAFSIMGILKPSPLSFLSGEKNSPNTTPILASSFIPWKSDSTCRSLSSINPSETKWPCKETYASLIIPNLSTSE
ncbi:hypothetical protein BD769DRAFT_1680364 [Suillus cothurnatus]|nr:hypothetical protein BD769DRAFT_1680364 [Suillus cothurnatus]